jgi:predicted transcriptional regulator
MSVHEPLGEPSIGALPGELDSPRAKLVYLYLDVTNGASLEEIQETLDLKKITLFSILDSLDGRDMIDQDGEHYALAA